MMPLKRMGLAVVVTLGWLSQPSHAFQLGAMHPRRATHSRSSPSFMAAYENENVDGEPVDLSLDDRLYRVRLDRFPGIDWGTDLSFSFVYVRGMEPAGAASLSGLVDKGDQLCEIIPVPTREDETVPVIGMIGAPFDFVMSSFAELDRRVQAIDFVFFRGTKDELKEACAGDGGVTKDPETIAVTVVQNKGAKDERTVQLTAPAGVNVRQLLVDNGINVYQSVTRWTNCKGKQLCGTCIVNIAEGANGTNRKSMDEESTLRENPEGYRISCVTFAYGDITVETFPPINPAQWTR
uniref:2Fe-2S ferredoxin-type domain-containing protein n=1 Tax=Craspedostauros australis TaxID=1486917 RepID=A0A7R9ZQ23_9STRA|mmetsp:Transcript_2511/g.6985  ORF Transcript_2511/g.6985 Transcript_2511/m.6985 type:complete len:294 (+) Transcript_2511:1549-2430(+)|eukprot:CAMPEP_0198110694 /NCGR_PEP_ID=MMETSP1442-20131203/2699_1 /TAXON_ID= /ORGANISM="Craspedostauros australis, Strain CCMP3328" /LENGTH=293 /DNA_ID=CAMNT_0043766859 /DNA_START=1546 /DNA_END=2427 /DNA_ORIENTATION=+